MHVLVNLCMHTRCVVRGRTKQLAASVSHPRFFQYSIHYFHAYITTYTHTHFPRSAPAHCAVGSNANFIVGYCIILYGGITPLCSLSVFYFTVSDTPIHTPPNQGRVAAMGRHTFGSFSASRRSWWAILRQCTGLCLFVDTNYATYH